MKSTNIKNRKGNPVEYTHLQQFSTMGEWVDYVDGNKITSAHSRDRGNKDWCGTETWEGAVDLGRYGDPELVQTVADEHERIMTELNEPVLGYRPDVEGLFFDVGQVIQDVPEAWYDMEPCSEKPVVQVVVDFMTAAMIDAEYITRRGAAILAVIDMLAKDHIVEVQLVSGNNYGDGYVTQIDFLEHPLDIDAVSFAVAHPSFLRRLWFSALEMWTSERSPSGYGSGTYSIPEFMTEGKVYFPGFYNMTSEQEVAFRCTKNAAAEAVKIVKEFTKKRNDLVTTF